MPGVVVTDPSISIHTKAQRVVAVRDGLILQDWPINRVESVTLMAGSEISRSALDDLLRHRISVHYVGFYGDYLGSALPPNGSHVDLRVRQALAFSNSGVRLGIARSWVVEKIVEQRQVLLYRVRGRDRGARDRMAEICSKLDRAAQAAADADQLPRLLGIEGSAAKLGFAGINVLLPEDFRFAQRNRRPPRDPFNAMISLGYAVATTQLVSLLASKGFDPFLGFLHGPHRGRPALALDLLELVRAPWVDRWALDLVARRQVTPEDFETVEGRGVRLAHPERRRAVIRMLLQRFHEPLPGPLATGKETCLDRVSRRVNSLQSVLKNLP